MIEADMQKCKAMFVLIRKGLNHKDPVIIKYAGMLLNNLLISLQK